MRRGLGGFEENANWADVMFGEALNHEQFAAAVHGAVAKEEAAVLFDVFNQTAGLPYEDVANTGFIFLQPLNSPEPLLALRFERPFDLQDIRGTRKLLQITGEKLWLLCNGSVAAGFMYADCALSAALTVEFKHNGIWELKAGGTTVLNVDATNRRFARHVFDEPLFLRHLRRVFGDLGAGSEHHLCDLISCAVRQRRGTNVLISGAAEAEADRLACQGTRIERTLLNSVLMERISLIDGTVVIDPDGFCYGIGMILDGSATKRGDRARGGRLNSALMYVDGSPFSNLIVVVSQDGTIEFITHLQ